MHKLIPLDLTDAQPREEVIRFKSETYVLTEASEAAYSKYRAALLAAAGTGGPTRSPEAYAEARGKLVADCLYLLQQSNPGVRVPVPYHEVAGWGQRVVGRLFQRVRELSDMDEVVKPATAEAVKARLEELGKEKQDLEDTLKRLEAGGEPNPT